jgi:hypothetical protein
MSHSLYFFFRSAGLLRKLRPYVLPVVGAELLQHKRRIDVVQFAGKTCASQFQTFADLIKVLLVNIDLLCDFAPPLWGVSWDRHARNSSVLLAFVSSYLLDIFSSYLL